MLWLVVQWWAEPLYAMQLLGAGGATVTPRGLLCMEPASPRALNMNIARVGLTCRFHGTDCCHPLVRNRSACGPSLVSLPRG